MEQLDLILRTLTNIEASLGETSVQLGRLSDSIGEHNALLLRHDSEIRELQKLVDRRDPEYCGEKGDRQIEFTIRI